MIHNDQELAATQERIAYLIRLLVQLRVTTTLEEFPAVASGYHAEVARMQQEVFDYLSRHASEPIPNEQARYPLRGQPVQYDEPTLPVAQEDWNAAH